MNTKQKKQLNKLIAKHVAAQVELSWVGSKMPEEHEEIETDARVAAQRLASFIDTLVEKE